MRTKLFANRAVPLATRRTLLYALGLARFIHGAGTLHLNQKGHQRAWHSAYISIWAHLVPHLPGSKPHSFQVFLVSKAPPPHLFLASQRAALLVRLVSRSFVSVLHLLQLEWEAAHEQSWLSQIVRDIKAVSLWVQTVSNFGQGRWPLRALCRQTELDPTWWSSCVVRPLRRMLLTLSSGSQCQSFCPCRRVGLSAAISAMTPSLSVAF